MFSRLCVLVPAAVLFVFAHTTVQAQEPTVGGFDVRLVQSPTVNDPLLIVEVEAWVDAGCVDETWLFSGNLYLQLNEASRTVEFDWWECRLLDPHGVGHCQLPPFSQPRQIDFTLGPFGWLQGIYGGEPVFGASLVTHEISFIVHDMTPRTLVIRPIPDVVYGCGREGPFQRPDEYAETELRVVIGCPADLDGDGELSLFDFLAFQNLFDAGDPAADFDGDGELTLFDFLAFQNAFDAGC